MKPLESALLFSLGLIIVFQFSCETSLGVAAQTSNVTTLCSPNDTDTSISWCYYQNKGRVPFVFNYTYNYTFESTYSCDSPSSDWDECSYISSVALSEITDAATNVTYHVAIIATSQDVVVFELNSEQILTSAYLPNDTITFVESYKFNDTLTYVIIGSDRINGYYILPQTFPNLTRNPYPVSFPFEMDVIQAQFFFDTNSSLIVAVLLYNKQSALYSLSFTKINNVGSYDPNFMSWILSDKTEDIDFQVFTLKGNFSVNANNVSVYNSQTLVMIYDSTYVAVYLYQETQTSAYIPFGSSSYYSNFYTSNDTILVAGIWTESSPRSYYNPKTGFPVNDVSQSVWLVLGVDSEDNHTLQLIALPEFAQYNFTYTGNTTNPVQRVLCENANQYYNVYMKQCENRPMYTDNLLDEPSILRTRYVPQIQSSQVQTDNGDNNMNKTVSAYRAIFVANDRRITVYGAAPTEMTEFDLDFEWFNEFNFFGTVEKLALSQNAQHLFASTSRFSWELESMERYYNICSTLNNGTSDQKKFLSAYQSNCDENEGRLPNLNDFYQHVTMCPLGLYCPSFFEQDFQELDAGWYTINSFQKHPCEPGYFCYKGNRQTCPKGFICPDYAMTAPLACDIDPDYETTCYDEQLTAPAVCPDGFSCPTPYMPPMPAPPGRFTYANMSRNFFGDCTLGDWCALGRYLTDNNNETTLECPENTFCTNSSILTPTACYCDSAANNCSYCPTGSTEEQPCPRGYYCEGPSNIQACKLTQYCPPGTITPQVCPAGWYCPDPSTQEVCPKGYYCKVGTVVPEKCPWLSICPQGTKTETHNFLGGLLLGIAVLAIAVPWKLWERYRDKKRAQRDVIRKALKKQRKEEEILLIDKSESRSNAALSELKPVDFTIDFDFKDLGLELPGGKKVLAGVTGNIRHGRVTAVMGPSGAGKTTFLSTLSGKVSTGTILGSVHINGQKDDIANYKKVMGFVPQEDIMLTMLTVKEILLMSAELRLPSNMSNEEKHVLVNSVIDVLGLTDVRYSIIGDATKRGISGGQRKRVNIGMELVSSPTVLFLDEPTSGLDSSSSQEVCDALRKIATLGITVVTVIHQPRYEIFTMFDDVLLLGKGGRTVYLGPTNKALGYFTDLGFECPQHSNPADFFMDVISGSVPRKDDRHFEPADLFKLWEEKKDDKRWSRSIENDLDIAHNSNAYDKKYKDRNTAGFFKQLILFFIRGITQQTRDLPGLALDAGLVCLAGVFLGLVFNNAHYVGPPEQAVCNGIQVESLRARCELPLNDPVGTIGSLSTLCLALTAVAASLRVFGAERVVFWRESASGINTLAYFLGKDISYIPNMLVAPLLFEALFYSITAPRSTFIDLYFILLCVEIVSVSLGFLVSIVVKPSVSQLTGVVIVMIMVMFSGMRPTLKEFENMSFPMPYVPWLSFPRWAQEALYINEIKHYQTFYNINTGLDALGYKLDNFALDIWMILIIALVFRVSAFVALQFLNRDKRK